MKTSPINPFANESDALTIGDLKVENRLDRVSIYGSAEITRDQAGLKTALTLQQLLSAIVEHLQKETLPASIETNVAPIVPNPFEGEK